MWARKIVTRLAQTAENFRSPSQPNTSAHTVHCPLPVCFSFPAFVHIDRNSLLSLSLCGLCIETYRIEDGTEQQSRARGVHTRTRRRFSVRQLIPLRALYPPPLPPTCRRSTIRAQTSNSTKLAGTSFGSSASAKAGPYRPKFSTRKKKEKN